MRKPKFLEYVVSQYIEYGEGRQNIVFAVDIQHAKELQQVFEDNGFEGKVARVDSTMSDTEVEKAFKDFESGAIQHLINVEMVTEGVDLPIAGCVTGARPTKSLTLYLQMAGRGGRPDGENDYFILLDCCGWTAEYGTIAAPKTWSLNPEIDPNGGRSGYKVFRANNDGKLEEVDDDFIGEVIELSPEEYLQQLAGGKDQAEAINVSIDDKIAALFQEIIKLLAKMMKELNDQKDFVVTYNYEHSDKKIVWTHKSESDNSWRSNQFSLLLRKGSDPKVRLENTDSDTAFAYFQTLRFAGKLGENVLQMIADKKTSAMNEMMEQVERLQKTKIDMEQFKKAESKLAAEQREVEINEHARLDGTFIFNKKIYHNDYFKNDYNVNIIKGIVLGNGKINGHHNTIVLIAEDTKWNDVEKKYVPYDKRVEKKYVKGDKVLEMIEDGKWNIEVEAKA